MSADSFPDDPRAAWQGQPAEPFRVSPDALRTRAARSRRRLRMLSAAQRAGAVIGILFSAIAIALADDAAMRGSAIILATLFAGMLTFWFRRPAGAARRTSSDGDASLAYLRAELVRHRDRDRGLRLWARLGLGLPAAIVFCLAFARAYPALTPFIYVELAAIVIVLPIVFLTARRRSRRYDRELAELDALQPLD